MSHVPWRLSACYGKPCHRRVETLLTPPSSTSRWTLTRLSGPQHHQPPQDRPCSPPLGSAAMEEKIETGATRWSCETLREGGGRGESCPATPAASCGQIPRLGNFSTRRSSHLRLLRSLTRCYRWSRTSDKAFRGVCFPWHLLACSISGRVETDSCIVCRCVAGQIAAENQHCKIGLLFCRNM